jgi:hypothetical protein
MHVSLSGLMLFPDSPKHRLHSSSSILTAGWDEPPNPFLPTAPKKSIIGTSTTDTFFFLSFFSTHRTAPQITSSASSSLFPFLTPPHHGLTNIRQATHLVPFCTQSRLPAFFFFFTSCACGFYAGENSRAAPERKIHFDTLRCICWRWAVSCASIGRFMRAWVVCMWLFALSSARGIVEYSSYWLFPLIINQYDNRGVAWVIVAAVALFLKPEEGS